MPLARNQGGTVGRTAQRHFHRESRRRSTGGHLQNEWDATAEPAIDLDDPRAVRRELDLRVQATGLHADCAHGGRGDIECRSSLGRSEIGRDEETGLPERWRQRESPGHREVLDDPGADDGLHREIVGESLAEAGRRIGDVLLEHHVRRVAVEERPKGAHHLIGVTDAHGRAAVGAVTRLEDSGESHAAGQLRHGVVGQSKSGGRSSRHRQAAVASGRPVAPPCPSAAARRRVDGTADPGPRRGAPHRPFAGRKRSRCRRAETAQRRPPSVMATGRPGRRPDRSARAPADRLARKDPRHPRATGSNTALPPLGPTS